MSIVRIKELEDAIRLHRAQKADDRCIEDDDKLYAILGDGILCDRRVGDKVDMLQNCIRFINNRCESGNWPSYAELEEKLKKLQAFKDFVHNWLDKEGVHTNPYPEDGCRVSGRLKSIKEQILFLRGSCAKAN